MSAKPSPVPVNVVCSLCGLAWPDHGDKPTTEDCIRLLKAELSRRPVGDWWRYPTYPTWVYPNVWSGTSISCGSQTVSNGVTYDDASVAYRTPVEAIASPTAA